MHSVTFDTDGRTYAEQVNHPAFMEDAGFVEPALGSLRQATLAAFRALDIDGNGLHDEAFKVKIRTTQNSVQITISVEDE